MKIVKYDD